MSFDRKMVALAAAVAELESPGELLAAVELLAARAGTFGKVSELHYVIHSGLGALLGNTRVVYRNVERLPLPDMSSEDGGAVGSSPSHQLTALLPLVQAVEHPEVAMRLFEEIEALAVHRMRGKWSPLWFEVRGRALAALSNNKPGGYEWEGGAFLSVGRSGERVVVEGKSASGVPADFTGCPVDRREAGGDVRGLKCAICGDQACRKRVAAAGIDPDWMEEYAAKKPDSGGVAAPGVRPRESFVFGGFALSSPSQTMTRPIQDPLGCGVLVIESGKSWRLVAEENTIMACVPGPEEFRVDPVSGAVFPWWVTSFDCRKSEDWSTYLTVFEMHWPGLYTGPREAYV